MFKQILVPATGTAEDAVTFATALKASRLFDAHLEFLHARPDPIEAVAGLATMDGAGGFAAGELMDTLERMGAEGEAKARAEVAALQLAEGLTSDAAAFTVQVGDAARWLARYGRTADLIVSGRWRGEDVAMALLQQVLFEGGRPLLLAPRAAPASLHDVVVVAWKDTAEAARAVAAAMPFITRATEVLVLTVDEGADDATEGSCERLVATLSRHTPYVAARHLAAGGGRPADVLLAAAAKAGASLLVMGGYGHSRAREMVFGGFTQRVLRDADMPVLMMH
ncbi:universal stress protein [Roseococcus sp.]|uniref:universal stress protein n=1 Tax=Roseococcus sp. TaxID=2109646 RepID=UPI003BA9807B